jgi:hypothetical protein
MNIDKNQLKIFRRHNWDKPIMVSARIPPVRSVFFISVSKALRAGWMCYLTPEQRHVIRFYLRSSAVKTSDGQSLVVKMELKRR